MFKNRPTAMVVYVGIVAFVIMVIAALVVPPAAESVPPTVAVPTSAPSTADATGSSLSGADFMATTAADPDVHTTASGLMYKVITEGSGPKPTATDTVTVNYEGRLVDGTVFDSSYARNQPATFAVNGVIAGWTEALQLMPVGSKYTLYIPPELGYGSAGNGPVPGNATLIFDVELLSIQ